DTEFGLASGVFTNSFRNVQLFKDGLKSGLVSVNLPAAGMELLAPFGGIKQSSFGPREQGRYARDFYTSIKTTYALPLDD
ncbi:MAG: aldehyde dehydrogenase family protein, partial [Thermomicrobiales bacterium]